MHGARHRSGGGAMNMKASSLFQTKPVDRPLLAPKGKSEVQPRLFL